ncbi:polyubiquitin-like [Magnolia sinica]|uniref:polyubiquitin-like n=1 Tax=Magnolia sinica TaxID=86752 RepID=UPI002659207B|nr:polyubiquitin-like [Magnolia sinica]
MDVIFETSKGKTFIIEVGYFDTVLEMKEKIEKYEGIPIDRQTLVFNGQAMSDDRDTEFYEVLLGSHIHLMIESNSEKPIKIEEPPSKLNVSIKIPSSKRHFVLEVDITDTVNQLKERIHESEGIPVSRFVLFVAGVELQDHRSMGEYGVTEHSEINVILKPLPPQSVAGPASKKLKLMVQPKCGTRKIPVEVSASDNVGELKKELQRLHHQLHFHLPQEGYFFIYKQNVMEDERTFRWHDVRQGDTIEIFNGSVTGGS